MPTKNLLRFLIALFLLPSWVNAQEGGEEDAPFTEIVNVEVINVDVYVTDKDGKPVTGLTRDDFVVEVDKRPVEVTNFYAVEDGRQAGEAAVPVAPVEEMDAGVTLREIEEDPHRLWLIVYVDNFNIDPIHRKRIFPDLRLFLGQTLREGDQAMVANYDRSLKVEVPFTSDLGRLYEALDEMEDDIGHVSVRKRERKEALEHIADSNDEFRALTWARRYAESEMNDVQMTVRALREMIDSLAGLPGRKAVLYVTSGVPMRAGEEMFHAVATIYDSSRAYSEISRHDTSRTFDSLSQHANANRVVFHTMDAGGLRSMEFGAAEYGSFMKGGLRSTLESTVNANQQASLRYLARETGGRAILNRNATLPALEEVGADFRTFYSLGIQNTDYDEGRFHDIQVEVVREDLRGELQVRYRKGYRAKSIDSRMAEALRSALLYDQTSNPLGVQVDWGRPAKNPEGKHHIMGVRLQIPMSGVLLLPAAAGKWEMRLKLYVAVVDERGDISEIGQGHPLGLRLAEKDVEAARTQTYMYTHRLLIEAGRQKVAVGLLDELGNRWSIVSRFINVGE